MSYSEILYPLGANNDVLEVDNALPRGVGWTAGGGGGGITAVNAGNNIDVNTVGTIATVSLQAPLTTNLDMGAVDITTSTVNGNIETVLNGTGALVISQGSIGGSNNPATTFQNTNGSANAVHIDLYKNSATPANNDGIGILSYHANNSAGAKIEYARIATNQRDVLAASENGSISFLTCLNSPVPTEFFRCDGSTGANQLYRLLETNGLIIQNSLSVAGLNLRNTFGGSTTTISTTGVNSPIVMGTGNTGSPITITTTAGGSAINLTSFTTINTTSANATNMIASGGDINITSSGAIRMSGTGSGIVLNQPLATSTRLTTTIPNVNYYPDYVVSNGNANTAVAPLPSIFHQRLTLVNQGITPPVSWVAFGANVMPNPEDIYAQYFDPVYNQIWIGGSSGNLYVYDITLTTLISSATVSGTASGSGTQITCITGDNLYVYVGGDFSIVNTNATGQYGIARFALNPTVSPTPEDILQDAGGEGGVNGGYVKALSVVSGVLFVGGSFNYLAPTMRPVNFFFQIVNCQGATNTQFFQTSNGGNSTDLNGYVLAIHAVSLNEVYVGGIFTASITPATTLDYIAYYDSISCGYTVLPYIGGGVHQIKPSAINGNYLLISGVFGLGSPYENATYYDRTTNTYIDTQCSGINASGIYIIQCQGSRDYMSIYSSNEIWYSTVIGTWTNLGSPLPVPPAYVSSILYVAGYTQVAMYDTEQNYKEITSSQGCTFTLPSVGFTYTTSTKYINCLLNSPNTSLQFIADSTGTYWICLGTNSIATLS